MTQQFFREYDVPGWGNVAEFDAYAMPDMLGQVGEECQGVNKDQKYVEDTDGDFMYCDYHSLRSYGYSKHKPLQCARDLLEKGWPEGGEIIKDLAEQIRPHLPPPKDLRRMIAYRDLGDELVTERLYSGRVDTMWRTRKRRYAPTQTDITIASHYCTFSYYPEEAILSGSVGVALAYLLEQFGYRVEIFGILTVNPYGDRYRHQRHSQTQVAIAHLKRLHQPLQLDYIAAALHPAPTFLLAKRMVTELTWNCPFKGRADRLKCNDSARVFVTDWMQHGGRRVDFASDYVGCEAGCITDARECVELLGGRIFEGQE